MEKETSSTVDFLNNIDKDDLFKEDGAEEAEETGNEVEEEEKPIAFHQDPKVQRYVQKEIAKALKDVKPSAEQTFREEVSSDVQDVIGAFTTIIGNDTPEKVKALAALEKTLNGADERASKKAIERFQQQMQEQQQQQAEQDNAAMAELDEAFESIEENYNVDLSSNAASAKQLRAQFIDYVRKIAHKDENGEVDQFPDMDAAFEAFQERNKRAPASRAKELASRGMARSNDTTGASEGFKSSQGDPWKQVDRLFSKLKS
jgi:hypothetical protein